MPIGYTQEQLEYLQKRPADATFYETVTFSHPAIGDIRLVANQFRAFNFLVDSVSQEFKPVSMSIPNAQNQNSKIDDAGSIKFGRIGMMFRKEMRKVTRYTGFDQLKATIAIYSAEFSEPVRVDELLVPKSGIAINEEAVTVKLTLDNPAMITKKERSYLPEIFVGLE